MPRSHVIFPRSSGLGLSAVECILREKGYVAVLDLKQPDETAIGPAQSKVKFWELDIKQVEDVIKVVEEVVSWARQTGALLGGIINCAGVGTAAKVGEVLRFRNVRGYYLTNRSLGPMDNLILWMCGTSSWTSTYRGRSISHESLASIWSKFRLKARMAKGA